MSTTLPYPSALVLATIATLAGGLGSVVLANGLASQLSGSWAATLPISAGIALLAGLAL